MRKSEVVATQDFEKHENDASVSIQAPLYLNDNMVYNYATL
jgi:hypothetical protein